MDLSHTGIILYMVSKEHNNSPVLYQVISQREIQQTF